jgi:pyruvate/2-oxoglutarate dehydrogenase complex dihydrolipoamide acyltransferase (E2) component
MLMRLEMPVYNKMIQGGCILKWHKGEGDQVNFGDTLLEIRIDSVQLTSTRALGILEKKMTTIGGDQPVNQKAPGWQRKLLKAILRPCYLFYQLLKKKAPAVQTKPAVFVVSVISSDTGIMSKILAKEGEFSKVGDLLAILTTEAIDPTDRNEVNLEEAGRFRAVADVLSF